MSAPPEQQGAPAVAAEEESDEVRGLTELTMTDAVAKRRQTSFKNTELPRMRYESDASSAGNASGGVSRGGGRGRGHRRQSSMSTRVRRRSTSSLTVPETRQRSNSDPGAGYEESDDDDDAEDKQATLAYWQLEREFRELKDKLVAKAEECNSLESYKDNLTQEMDDLTTSLFEEAHSMVHSEKVARATAERQCKEALAKNDVLTEEVKALKTIVAHMQASLKPKAYIDAADAKRAKEQAAAQQRTPDAVLFRLFRRWHAAPTLSQEGSAFLASLHREDVGPCLKFGPSTTPSPQSDTVLKAIQDNTICIMMASATKGPTACALCASAGRCNFRLKANDTDKEWLSVCRTCRNKVVAVCDFYMYARHITQGLVKSPPPDVFWRIIDLRLKMSRARLGLPIE